MTSGPTRPRSGAPRATGESDAVGRIASSLRDFVADSATDDLGWQLLEASFDPSGLEQAQQAAAEVLGELEGDGRAVQLLVDALSGNQQERRARTPRVRAAVARSLEKLGDERAIPALALTLGGVPADRQHEERAARLGPGGFDELEEATIGALISFGDTGVRTLAEVARTHHVGAAVRALGELARTGDLGDEGLDALAQVATHDFARGQPPLDVRELAITGLQQAGDPRFVDALARLVSRDRDFVKDRITALLDEEPPGGHFRQFVDDEQLASWLVLVGDFESAAAIGAPAVKPLSRHLQAPLGTPCERPGHAADALADIGTPDAIEALVAALRGGCRISPVDVAARLARVADATTKRAAAASLRAKAAAIRERWDRFEYEPERQGLMSESTSWQEVSDELADIRDREQRSRAEAEACDRAADLVDPPR